MKFTDTKTTERGSVMEDRHIQLDQHESLYHIDLILRTNDQGKYVAFDLFDNNKQEIIFTKRIRDQQDYIPMV